MNQISLWIGFHILIFSLLALDLGVLRRRLHAVQMKEGILWSLFWIVLSLGFNIFIYFTQGKQAAMEFLAGYLIEKSLSIDNIFVFVLIFSAFKVPARFQYKVLLFGIIGAFIMRISFILAGLSLIQAFHFLIYILGAFLCWTSLRLFFKKEKETKLKRTFFVQWLQNTFPFKEGFYEGKFFIRERGKVYFTSLFLALVVIEFNDLIFATDSIPAIFAITQDPFLVYTSNIFAILGLRAMYFVLANVLEKFHYLKNGLSVILFFTGLKMLLSKVFPIPVEWAFVVIIGVLSISILLSLYAPPKRR
jgi:tellurite resistance protein TerC